ncbi:hypothetical protein CSB11_02225 [Candidatus Campbellbacteria bacterium]|nr:MAG: hypothetical protein CSB11_02225 [Candidatus Campbellbacteria bacterium]
MGPNLEKPISNPKEDLNNFKQSVERKSMANFGNSFEKISENKQKEAVQNVVEEYIKQDNPENFDPEFLDKQEDAERIVLALSPEEDDEKISALLGSVQKNGIRNTIHAIEKTESFHIQDDFHRFLVQYIKEGYKSDIHELSPLYPGLHMTLFEVSLPAFEDEKEKEKKLEEILSSMEQFYAGMFSVADVGKNKEKYFSIEIAYPQGRAEVVFFCAVPNEKKNIFKNQLLAIFPKASVKEITDDYNIFNKQKHIAYADVDFEKSDILPIKTYKQLNYDPLNIILKSFSNLAVAEGAAIQLVLSPASSKVNDKAVKALDKVQKGEDIKTSLEIKNESIFSGFGLGVKEILFPKKDGEKEIKDGEKRGLIAEEIRNKNSSRFYKTNLRLIAAGNSQYQADAILLELESAFNQFEHPNGNKFVFHKVENKNKLNIKVQDYTYRVFDKNTFIYLNTTELTSIFHFPYVALKAGDNLSVSSFTSSGVSKKLMSEAQRYGQNQNAGQNNSQSTQKRTAFSFGQQEKKKVEQNQNDFVQKVQTENSQSEPKVEPKTEVQNSGIDNFVLEKPKDDWTIKGDGFVFETKQRAKTQEEEYMEDFGDDFADGSSFIKSDESKVKPKTKEENINSEILDFQKKVLEQNQKNIEKKNQILQNQNLNQNQNKIQKENQTDFQNKPKPNIPKKESPKNTSASFENLGDASFKNEKPILLGFNDHQGVKTDIYMKAVDRMKHMYVVGKSGTGKTSILKNMVVQDIQNGDGVCFIDPHGSDIQDILAQIPPERYDDVIYFDPTNLEKPMGLNMMEYDVTHPEQKSFVVDELLGIFKKLYSSVPESMGPAFEQYFRNATMLVLEDPQSGNTMVEISRVLSDEEFRNMKLSRCKNMIVKQFWEKIATQAGGESELANIVPYITNKFDVFLSNDFLRPIIAQEKSAFNFRDIMDQRKILLVNMSKGKLGDINANLIGLIIVGKILMAALSRVDSLDSNLPPFYLYIDEFQNVTTDSISQILSEARKYKLSLNIAHQFISQIDEGIRDAVFGNVGSMAIFRVGPEDAEFLEKQVAPTFGANDIMNLKNWNCYIKMLVDGEPQKAFNLATYPPKSGDAKVREYLKQMSIEKYGRPREEIENEVMEKFKTLI